MKKLILLIATLALAACTDSPVIILGPGAGGGGGTGGAGGGGDYCTGLEVLCQMNLTQPGETAPADSAPTAPDACESCGDGQTCADGVCL